MDPAPATVRPGHLITQTRRLSLRSSSPSPCSPASSAAGSPQRSLDDGEHVTASPAAAAASRRANRTPSVVGVTMRMRGDSRAAVMEASVAELAAGWYANSMGWRGVERVERASLDLLPNEVLFHVLGFLDVSDLLATSRATRHLRSLSLAPILHHYRLRRTRDLLPPLLCSPCRPSLAELIQRHIFLTHTTVVSRRLARSLVSIRLARRLAARPSAEALVQRAVLPQECVPGFGGVSVAPALVARRRAFERERVKDGLSKWIKGKWRGEVKERQEGVRKWEESKGIGRVWRLRRFWERVARGEERVAR